MNISETGTGLIPVSAFLFFHHPITNYPSLCGAGGFFSGNSVAVIKSKKILLLRRTNNFLKMKIRPVLSIFLITVIIVISGCGNNKELKKDVAGIAASMCKITGVMHKLRAADPADSVAFKELQMEAKQCQIEMTILNQEFQQKYKSKITDEKFKKEYSREFRKAILNCSYLSKEDRERYEKEIE
jgi:hypothetical protein